MSAPLLSINNLSLSIGSRQIIRDLSLEIRAGEVLGLVGESGSGKSLTALSILRLLPHRARLSGSIRLDGEELTDKSEAAMCALRGNLVSMVFQEPMTALNPVKTIGAQVAESLAVHGKASRAEAEREAALLLDRVGLTRARVSPDRFPHELSGGQRQRVVIAMAIACRPKLLIADEPTTALDVTVQAQILDLLKEIVGREKIALLLISHDLAVVADMAARIAIMKDGELVEEGPTRQLLRGFNAPYSRRLLAASSHMPKRIAASPAAAGRKQTAATPLLRVDRLTVDYPVPGAGFLSRLTGHGGRLRAVDGVSLEVAEGESVGLVGESGCGKSTLARTILGLQKPSGGTILIDGKAPHEVRGEAMRALRRKVQVVFQDPYGSFDPRQTVEQAIAEPLHLYPELKPAQKRRRVADALVSVGLTPKDGKKYPHEFSGGQRQRIGIARALVTEPKLIIADEPVSALDVSIRAQVLDLFACLQDRLGLSYLFISHDLTVVRAITDRVVVMNGGVAVEEGKTAAVLTEPSHPYTKLLVASAPDLDAILRRREAEEAGLSAPA
ncbi:microcin ABC transporter ATP-binding protein [Pannonibacter phragmitetus]|uniref:ABC transporter ATP-binding protein n=1 Tax=Pannonibacter phragmitetus TaxID=121719 RepID=UPI00067BE8A5|nr:dipeptide ABC transporter ATP-binding protein [Pannonibacter phragmitetus]KND21229.1 microcin ABC transporter ATP-binding protein [Pannonibacter phragmitetus]